MIFIWSLYLSFVCYTKRWPLRAGWGPLRASGFRGWEEPHFLWPASPDPRWLLYWCSHCSDLSSLPLMQPLAGAIKDQRASPQTRCFTWQVVSAAWDWNIHSRWKNDGPVNNIQMIQTSIKPGSVQVDATSGMVFIRKLTLHYKMMDGVKDGKGLCLKQLLN